MGNDMYLYCGTGRMLQFNKSVAFILEFVHLALVGQQTVVLEVLNEVKLEWGYLRFVDLEQLPVGLIYLSVKF